jgi:xanthine dehydrogenase accessory factor
MNKQYRTWKLIDASLEQHIPVMLLYVLDSKGSSPGRQGFFMAVNAEGEIEGSIGGGIMEHKFVEMVKEQLHHITQGYTIRKQQHNKSAATNQSGMICSGEQTILLYAVQQHDAIIIKRIIASLEQNKNGLLRLSPEEIQFHHTPPANDINFIMRSENDWLYEEKTGYKNHLYIIGGGHCALALSELARGMDFYITVFEDRQELYTLSKNDYVHKQIIVDNYEQLAEMITPGDHHYVVIMTVGYRTDDVALRSIWNKDVRYIGVLGSQKKIEEMFNTYKAEGISNERLQKIHAPAGIAIKSQTPEEIAVSIMAELIRTKNS